MIRRNQETTDKEEYVMKKFRVTVTETLKRFVDVEAENEDEAAENYEEYSATQHISTGGMTE